MGGLVEVGSLVGVRVRPKVEEPDGERICETTGLWIGVTARRRGSAHCVHSGSSTRLSSGYSGTVGLGSKTHRPVGTGSTAAVSAKQWLYSFVGRGIGGSEGGEAINSCIKQLFVMLNGWATKSAGRSHNYTKSAGRSHHYTKSAGRSRAFCWRRGTVDETASQRRVGGLEDCAKEA